MIKFPKNFAFGISTAAAQIESIGGHDWVGFRALDGSVFQKTTDHERLWESDVGIISSLAPNYRMSLLWSRLQVEPNGKLEAEAVRFYLSLMESLRSRGVRIMLVLHHFENPIWFTEGGGWHNSKSVGLWLNYVKQVVEIFGDKVTWWNTFNEPNLYLSMGYLSGQFPPFKKNPLAAFQVLKNIAQCHKLAYDIIKGFFPETLVGLSHNSVLLESDNFLGKIPAALTDWWYMEFIPSWYGSCDFFGMSYYARIGYDPRPVTYLYTPEKFESSGKSHDKMWEYYPEGIGLIMRRYWNRFKKPIMITENGVATDDDRFRIKSIYEYLLEIRKVMDEGVPCLGYFHWTAWDNFEWNLGVSYRFGLYKLDRQTMIRSPRDSAGFYSNLAHSHIVSDPRISTSNVA